MSIKVDTRKSQHSKFLRGPDGDVKSSRGGFRKKRKVVDDEK